MVSFTWVDQLASYSTVIPSFQCQTFVQRVEIQVKMRPGLYFYFAPNIVIAQERHRREDVIGQSSDLGRKQIIAGQDDWEKKERRKTREMREEEQPGIRLALCPCAVNTNKKRVTWFLWNYVGLIITNICVDWWLERNAASSVSGPQCVWNPACGHGCSWGRRKLIINMQTTAEKDETKSKAWAAIWSKLKKCTFSFVGESLYVSKSLKTPLIRSQLWK